MTAERIEDAKRSAERSRTRLESTLAALQARLHPRVLANDAWDGVRDKGNDLADGAMEAVKKRPAAVSAAVGAIALFLAREPLKRAVSRLFTSEEEEELRADLVTTRVEPADHNYETIAPVRRGAIKEGVS